jgi:hypothetical protein
MRREEETPAALEAALAENKRLRAEIERLEEALARHSAPAPEPASSDSVAIPCLPSASGIGEVTAPADKAAKVALFRTLFRGREDVFAERWRMKDGNWGYRPASRKNWEAVLASKLGKKQRQAAAEKLASIPDGIPRVILATGSYIGEGFDDSRLDTLFPTMPISWRGTLQQYVGRLHRIHDGKKFVRVYDYVDAHVPMFARMYEKRLKGYRAIGYELEGEPDNDADV